MDMTESTDRDSYGPRISRWLPASGCSSRTRGGLSFAEGAWNFLEDWERSIGSRKPLGADAFRPGHEVALLAGRREGAPGADPLPDAPGRYVLED